MNQEEILFRDRKRQSSREQKRIKTRSVSHWYMELTINPNERSSEEVIDGNEDDETTVRIPFHEYIVV